MRIRTLKESELELLLHYSSLENWDLEELETKILFLAHPNDFFIASIDDETVGFIVAIKHSQALGFISSFLVIKKFRSQKYGKKIFQYALAHLEPAQIALDAVTGSEKLYEKFGFNAYFDVCVYKFEVGSMNFDFLSLDNFDIQNSIKTQNLTHYQHLLCTDENVLCKSISQQKNENSFAYMFPYLDAYKIEIHATDINEALALYFAFTQELEEETSIYMKSDMLNPILLSLAKILNMQLHYKYTRMYNKIL